MDPFNAETLRARLPFSNLSPAVRIGLAVILVMVAVAAGRLLIGTATANEVVIESSAESDSENEGAEEKAPTLFVHVSGFVAHPGLVEVAEGSRVADAIEACGGILESGDDSSVNLARPLNDGEQIYISSRSDGNTPVGEAQGAASAVPSAPAGSGKININRATASELTSLPGIGDATAQKIISDRTANGPFASIEDLKRVSGIGEKKYESLADLITV